MRWYVIDNDYIHYLHGFDSRVAQLVDSEKLRPYFGIVLIIGRYSYYIPVTPRKAKYEAMKNGKDFFRICDPSDGALLGALNINNMVPVPQDCITYLDYEKIEEFRKFSSAQNRENYVNLLRKELDVINANDSRISKSAGALRFHVEQRPDDTLSRRCCDFALLEEKCSEYTAKLYLNAVNRET